MSAFTQTHIDKIEEAIAQGALRVKYADKEVTYRSLDEMLKIRAVMRKALGVTSSAPSRIYPSFSKGFTEDDE